MQKKIFLLSSCSYLTKSGHIPNKNVEVLITVLPAFKFFGGIRTMILEILYNKEICQLLLKKKNDLYVCPASFIISWVSDPLIL